jgi:hypothetical protein
MYYVFLKAEAVSQYPLPERASKGKSAGGARQPGLKAPPDPNK